MFLWDNVRDTYQIQLISCHGTKISVFGTDTSEKPRFSVPISVPKQNTKTC